MEHSTCDVSCSEPSATRRPGVRSASPIAPAIDSTASFRAHTASAKYGRPDKTALVFSFVLHLAVLAALAISQVGASPWLYRVAPGKPVVITWLPTARQPAPEPPTMMPIVEALAAPPTSDLEPIAVVPPKQSPVQNRPERTAVRTPEATGSHAIELAPSSVAAAPKMPVREAANPRPRPIPIPRSAVRVAAETKHVPVVIPETPNWNAGAMVDEPARKLPDNPPPSYPIEARQAEQEGRVWLTVDIDANGRVLQAELYQSSGFPLLDQAALRAVLLWRFSPAKGGGRSIASQLRVPIRFSLRR